MARPSVRRGHLTLKSSALAPTSTSYFTQHLIQNHMSSHYRRISSAKASIDTSAPKSTKQHIKVQDQKKRESMKDGRVQSNGYLSPGIRSKSTSLDNLSYYGRSPSHVSRPQSYEEDIHNTTPHHSTPVPFSSPRDNHSAHDEYLIYQQKQLKQEVRGPTSSPRALPEPLVSRDRWNMVQPNDTNNRTFKGPHVRDSVETHHVLHENPMQEDLDISQSLSRPNMAGRRLSSGYSHALDSSYGSSRMSSPRARRRKEIQTKMWEEEQVYMEFISDVTSDVLARGIFTNRVLNKVFDSHIAKREDLDEGRMREMIEQLKLDLNITDSL